VLGYYLAKELAEAGHKVTICTACEEGSKKMLKAPFTSWDELRDLGVKTLWGEPSTMASNCKKSDFDIIVDNNGKTLETVQPVIDWAKSIGAKQFLFVSSAGIYKPSVVLPVTEEAAVKESSGHAQVEKYASEVKGLEWSSFRPQYMVGRLNNKDCEEYFFDRIVRGRPIVIPGSGEQIVNIAHAADNAHMIALAVGNKDAYGQIYNCVRDKGVTLNGFVAMCGEAANMTANVVHYDPEKLGVEAKKQFPFRTEYHFFTTPANALKTLNWEPKSTLAKDLVERFAEYKAMTERMYAEMTFEADDAILDTLGWKANE